MTNWGDGASTPIPGKKAARAVESRGANNGAVGAATLNPGMFEFSNILAIADALPVMVAYLDCNLVFRFVNKPLAEWYEMERAALLGQPLSAVMSADTYADRRPRMEAALNGERQWFVAQFDHPSRGPLTVQANYVPNIVAPAGRVEGLVIVIQDITEQVATERALRESEERFRRIADSAPVPMWVTRADGSRDFVNQAYYDFFGGPANKVGLHDWQSAIHPDDLERTMRQYRAAIAGDVPVELMARFRRADGSWRWLRSVSMQRRDANGQAVGFIGAASDVTEAKESEFALQKQVEERTADLVATQDQLRQAQKMEALGQLTGGIAHDFNNLLTVVVGGLDLIAKRVDDERLLRYARNALAAAERGARLTAQLLAFSRVQRLEVVPVYVAPLIDEMRPLLRNVLGPGIDKKIDLDPHLMPVMADPTQLEVAVLNLAINARDAMPDGGTLTISSRRRRIRGDAELEDGDYVELSIADTGSGMPPEVVTRAFEPFFTTKDVGKGTGLGLSMVYGMARQSGGTARIESRDGKGTTVKLFFRRARQDGVVPSSGDKTGDQLRKEQGQFSILLIDDDVAVRSFVSEGLEDYGHEVVEAADGPSGLIAFANMRPDVVVLDFLMPGMSGAEVAERILADTPDQPILFVSGYNETDAIRRAAPNASILAKPFRPASLDEALRRLMGIVE
nr:PAS domain-containing sensor histidine kinase [uncultured Sphingomonas sp.]